MDSRPAIVEIEGSSRCPSKNMLKSQMYATGLNVNLDGFQSRNYRGIERSSS